MFKINDLTVKINDKKVLDDFNLTINDGEIHVIMGKNGIGKSTLCKVILNDPSYNVISGNIVLENENLLDKNVSEIAQSGVMLINQNPLAIEGVSNAELLRTALRQKTKKNVNIFEFNKKMEETCEELELDKGFIHKEINVGASGGEKKKVELLHMAILEPKFLILDEIDSGLDVDALKVCANFINEYHQKSKCSILIITHHPNIIELINPNYVHILSEGKITKTGDKALAKLVEVEGFSKANDIDEDGNHE